MSYHQALELRSVRALGETSGSAGYLVRGGIAR
jgi:hypothetical protein